MSKLSELLFSSDISFENKIGKLLFDATEEPVKVDNLEVVKKDEAILIKDLDNGEVTKFEIKGDEITPSDATPEEVEFCIITDVISKYNLSPEDAAELKKLIPEEKKFNFVKKEEDFARIVKNELDPTGSTWIIQSIDGEKISGPYKSKEEALKDKKANKDKIAKIEKEAKEYLKGKQSTFSEDKKEETFSYGDLLFDDDKEDILKEKEEENKESEEVKEETDKVKEEKKEEGFTEEKKEETFSYRDLLFDDVEAEVLNSDEESTEKKEEKAEESKERIAEDVIAADEKIDDAVDQIQHDIEAADPDVKEDAEIQEKVKSDLNLDSEAKEDDDEAEHFSYISPVEMARRGYNEVFRSLIDECRNQNNKYRK